MRFAVISDIHGNYKALEAFLEYIGRHPVDGIIGLGDYVTDGPYPQRIMKLLYEMQDRYQCILARGNREEYLLSNADNHLEWKISSTTGMLLYTLENLTVKDLKFFETLPSERKLGVEGLPTLYLCHGVPGRIRGNMAEEAGLRDKVLKELKFSYLLGGHSHFQEIFVRDGKTYINPGSLGLAFDGIGGNAQFAVLTGQGVDWRAERLSIPYDVEGFLKDFEDCGADKIGLTLNRAICKSLKTGINYFYKCITTMCGEAERLGYPSLDAIPEEEWKKLETTFDLQRGSL